MYEPSYYNKNGLSPVKAFEQGLLSYDEVIGFYKGNVIKYVVRLGDKEGASVSDDVRKAINYLHMLNDFIQEQGNLNKYDKSSFLDNELLKLKESIKDFKKENYDG